MAPPTLSHYQNAFEKKGRHPIFSLENIYRAYRRCRRRKRTTRNALAFELNLEENLLGLHEYLNDGTYVPGPSLAFLVEKSKQREIAKIQPCISAVTSFRVMRVYKH